MLKKVLLVTLLVTTLIFAHDLKVSFISGTVKVFDEYKNPIEDLKVGTKISKGYLLACGKDGKLQVKSDDGSLINLSKNTVLTIEEAMKQGKKRILSMKQKFGLIRCVTAKQTKGSKFELRTANAVCGVRGTDWGNNAPMEPGAGYSGGGSADAAALNGAGLTGLAGMTEQAEEDPPVSEPFVLKGSIDAAFGADAVQGGLDNLPRTTQQSGAAAPAGGGQEQPTGEQGSEQQQQAAPILNLKAGQTASSDNPEPKEMPAEMIENVGKATEGLPGVKDAAVVVEKSKEEQAKQEKKDEKKKDEKKETKKADKKVEKKAETKKEEKTKEATATEKKKEEKTAAADDKENKKTEPAGEKAEPVKTTESSEKKSDGEDQQTVSSEQPQEQQEEQVTTSNDQEQPQDIEISGGGDEIAGGGEDMDVADATEDIGSEQNAEFETLMQELTEDEAVQEMENSLDDLNSGLEDAQETINEEKGTMQTVYDYYSGEHVQVEAQLVRDPDNKKKFIYRTTASRVKSNRVDRFETILEFDEDLPDDNGAMIKKITGDVEPIVTTLKYSNGEVKDEDRDIIEHVIPAEGVEKVNIKNKDTKYEFKVGNNESISDPIGDKEIGTVSDLGAISDELIFKNKFSLINLDATGPNAVMTQEMVTIFSEKVMKGTVFSNYFIGDILKTEDFSIQGKLTVMTDDKNNNSLLLKYADIRPIVTFGRFTTDDMLQDVLNALQ